MKDYVEIPHVTKSDAFRMNRDQVMDLEISLKIHTNVSNFETASPKIILTLIFFYFRGTLLKWVNIAIFK